jgi:AcrR family transcriptional regulator
MAVTEKTRQRIVDALMALAAERRYADVTLADIAARAELSLSALREAYDGRLAILADFTRRIDRTVLAGIGETTEESDRDRLFEVMMRRFEALAPYKAGLRSIAAAARREPGLALALNAIVVRSEAWMLNAAGIAAAGPRAAVKAQGLALVHARAMQAWFDDDDPGLARTMAALDKGLRRGERALKRLDWLAGCLCRPLAKLDRLRREGRGRAEDPSPATGAGAAGDVSI